MCSRIERAIPMAGVKGMRTGGHNRKSVAHHLATGSYRPSRHGPRPGKKRPAEPASGPRTRPRLAPWRVVPRDAPELVTAALAVENTMFTRYPAQVLCGVTVAGPLVRAACRRFLADLVAAPELWDRRAAQHVFDFF
ncbi:MAG: hypothetical protein ACRD2X_03030 [Vicinamibacteraceae bacterium]